MVEHILFSVPMRYIDGNLVRKLNDIHEEYRLDAYNYAKSNNGIGIGGEFDEYTYISNSVFCKFIEECT